MPSSVKLKNEYIIKDDIVIIIIKNKKGIMKEFIIDREDFEKVKQYNWNLGWRKKIQDYYAQTSIRYGEVGNRKGKSLLMHNSIMNTQEGEYVDHKSHNVQNNRKNNLRKTSNSKNSQNRKGANKNNKTGVRNVHLITGYKGKQEYRVQIMKDGKRYYWEFPLDQFKEACDFAKIKRKELFKEYAGIIKILRWN